MANIAKLYDEAFEHEYNIMSDVEMLTDVRLKMYRNNDTGTLKEIFPVLNAIQHDVEVYREWLKEQTNDLAQKLNSF